MTVMLRIGRAEWREGAMEGEEGVMGKMNMEVEIRYEWRWPSALVPVPELKARPSRFHGLISVESTIT